MKSRGQELGRAWGGGWVAMAGVLPDCEVVQDRSEG